MKKDLGKFSYDPETVKRSNPYDYDPEENRKRLEENYRTTDYSLYDDCPEIAPGLWDVTEAILRDFDRIGEESARRTREYYHQLLEEEKQREADEYSK